MHRFYYEFQATLSAAVYHCSTAEPVFLNVMEPRNRFQGMNFARLCSLAGRYDNPIPTRFLAPINFFTIPAQIKHSPFTSLWGGSVSVDLIFMIKLGSKENSHLFFFSIKSTLILTFTIINIYRTTLDTLYY